MTDESNANERREVGATGRSGTDPPEHLRGGVAWRGWHRHSLYGRPTRRYRP
jgi:hypothetical protein